MGRLGGAKQPCRADRVFGSGGWTLGNARYGRLPARATLIASLCYVGRLVAAVLGARGLAATAVFEKWRPVFLPQTLAIA
jgi:hypothetical protein